MIELIAVITALSILASIILPAFGKAKRSVAMNQSKMQFSRYIFALNAYYREYGYFPGFLTSEAVTLLSDGTNSADFIRALSGRETDGVTSLTSDHTDLNPNGIQFLEFTDDDFYRNTDNSYDRSRIADQFNNDVIGIVIESDEDSDAVIPQSAFNAYSTIKDKVPDAGLREKVAIFTVGDNDRSIDVVSWQVTL